MSYRQLKFERWTFQNCGQGQIHFFTFPFDQPHVGQNTDTKTSILSKFVHSASHSASDMALSLEKDETIEVLKHGLTHVVAHDPSQGPLLDQCEEIAKYLYERPRSAAESKVKPGKSRSGKSGKPNWHKWNKKRAKEADEKVKVEPPAVKDVETSKEPDEKVKARPAGKDVKKRSQERREKVKAKAAVKDVKKRSKEPDEKVKRKKTK